MEKMGFQTLFKRGLPSKSSYKQFWRKPRFSPQRCRRLKKPRCYKTGMMVPVFAKDPVFWACSLSTLNQLMCTVDSNLL